MTTFKVHQDFPLERPDTRIEVLALLDKYFPNITDNIEIKELDMYKEGTCLLGQTIGYRNNSKMFKLFGGDDYNFASGTAEWKDAILQYRKNKLSELTPLQQAENRIAELEAKLQEERAKLEALRNPEISVTMTQSQWEVVVRTLQTVTFTGSPIAVIAATIEKQIGE